MPWTEKQVRLFRAAEHNRAIAKQHGLSQSEAGRMADEGVKGGRSSGKKSRGAMLAEKLRGK